MSGYRLTELANNDLWEIRDRILEDNSAVVLRRIMIELDAKLKLLCEFPGPMRTFQALWTSVKLTHSGRQKRRRTLVVVLG